MKILAALKAEWIKIKNSGLVLLAVFGSLTVNLAFLGVALFAPDLVFVTGDFWLDWTLFHYEQIMGLLLPMYLVILCSLSILIENANAGWKTLYALPFPHRNIYLSKLGIVVLIFVASHSGFLALSVASGVALGGRFDSTMPFRYVFDFYAATLGSSVGIIGIMFLIAYFVRPFIIPLLVGIIGFVLAQLWAGHPVLSRIWPFAYPAASLFGIRNGEGFPLIFVVLSVLVLLVSAAAGVFAADRETLRSRPTG